MIDLTGQKFGRWAVQEFYGRVGNKYYWTCVCDCGKTKKVWSSNLKNGQTKSCGCYKKERAIEANIKHGQNRKGYRTPIHIVWSQMIQRCYNPNNHKYKDYGGRGIKVCDRWRYSFENFYEDMGEVPEGLTLDRKDNDGDYTPENCHWATMKEQQNNRRDNVWITHAGETKTRTQWERSLGMKLGTLNNRLNRDGWSIKKALTTPVIGRGEEK
jgi:hypothetical protein